MAEVLIIGAARSGVAAAKLLAKHGYEITLTDSRVLSEKAKLQAQGITVADGGHPDWLLDKPWEFIVKNPGIPYFVPIVKAFVQKQVPIYTEVEIAARYARHFRYGAITGTNGKTTITSLLYEMLKRKGNALVAGNIGCPLCELALEYEQQEKDVALELSNFQLRLHSGAGSSGLHGQRGGLLRQQDAHLSKCSCGRMVFAQCRRSAGHALCAKYPLSGD